MYSFETGKTKTKGRKLLKADREPPLHRESQRVGLDEEESNTHNLKMTHTSEHQKLSPGPFDDWKPLVRHALKKNVHVSFDQLFGVAATILSPLSVLYIVLSPKPGFTVLAAFECTSDNFL